jgi:geranylgeranyl pyrophosphate synthase
LKNTKNYAIDNILRTKYDKLEEASLYNLLLKGKNFRSAILFLLAKSLYYNGNVSFEESPFYEKVMCLSACIEIAHNSSLLQDDIIDHSDSRRAQEAAHKVFGVSNTVFASNFMISRASRMLTHVFDENAHMSQLFSTVLYNLVFGEMIQAKRDMDS